MENVKQIDGAYRIFIELSMYCGWSKNNQLALVISGREHMPARYTLAESTIAHNCCSSANRLGVGGNFDDSY